MDRLFTNADVLTMDGSRPRAAAFLVRDGRIDSVGGVEELLARRPEGAAVIDLGGRTVVPGFVDAHTHFGPLVLSSGEIDMSASPPGDIESMQALFRASAAQQPAGGWVRGFGYSESALREKRHPTRWELDEAVPDRPAVAIHWTFHRLVANSLALDLAGIRRGATEIEGGIVHCDASGEPNGLLTEAATNPVIDALTNAVLARKPDEFQSWLESTSQRYFAAGVTSVHDAWAPPQLYQRFLRAAEASRLPIYYTPMRGHESGLFGTPAAWFDDPELGRRDWPGRFQRGGMKFFADAVWENIVFWPQTELSDMVTRAHAADLTVAVHATGDRGIELGLTAAEAARRSRPDGAGLRLEHVFLPSAPDLRRLHEAGVFVVTQPSSLWKQRVRTPVPGEQRPARIPIAGFTAAGVRVAFSSDAPCFPMPPLIGIACAVTRSNREGQQIDPEQAVSFEEAVRRYTLEAAAAGGSEDVEGSLAPGKLANFVVLAGDVASLRPDALEGLEVAETWVDGERVYERDGE